MKNIILPIIAVCMAFQPQESGKGQVQTDTAVNKPVNDTSLKVIAETRNSLDTIAAISNKLEKKLSKPKVVYRTITKVVHVPVKVPIHDTVFITETKYVAVPTDDYKFKQFQQYNDSAKKAKADSIANAHPKKKGVFLFFNKRNKRNK